MNPMFVAICTIAVFLAGSSNALPSPLLGLGQIENGLPVGHGGSALSGLTEALPIVGGSKGGLLEIRSPAIHSENSSLEPRGMVPELGSLLPLNDMPLLGGGDKGSGLTEGLPVLGGSGNGLLKRSAIDSQASSLEPRGMIPGLDNLSGMTGMIPGMGKSGGGLPGMNEFTSMMPGMGGSNGGLLKVRRSTDVSPSNVKGLKPLDHDTETASREKSASKEASSWPKSSPDHDTPTAPRKKSASKKSSSSRKSSHDHDTPTAPRKKSASKKASSSRKSSLDHDTPTAPRKKSASKKASSSRKSSLDHDTPPGARRMSASKNASSSPKPSGGLIKLHALPGTLSGLSV